MKLKFLTTIVGSLAIIAGVSAQTQNRYEEEIACATNGGQLVITATVKGKPYNFIVDVNLSRTKVFTGYAQQMGMRGDTLEKLGICDNLFIAQAPVTVTDDSAAVPAGLTGIAGVLGKDMFKEQVLTLDRQNKVITLSAPYKPTYMSLRNRADMISDNSRQAASIAGKVVKEPVSSLLDKGVLTLDFDKSKTYFEPYTTFKKPAPAPPVAKAIKTDGKMIELDRELFLKEVFNFREQTEWKYQGDKPCLIYTWAPWCGPCRRFGPIVKELAEEYDGRITFYKINFDEEEEVVQGCLGVIALPTLVYVPMEGAPKRVIGAFEKDRLRARIAEELLK